MIQIVGIHNIAVCYTDALDEKAAEQIKAVCDRQEFAGRQIRVMPDVHAGKGCTVGTTMTITDKIVPGMGLTGVDHFTTVHNYIDTDSMILCKGAVSAKRGERLLMMESEIEEQKKGKWGNVYTRRDIEKELKYRNQVP